MVDDVQKRNVGLDGHPAAQLDLGIARIGPAVPQPVLAEIPEHLVQLTGVHAHLHVRRADLHGDRLRVDCLAARELLHELLEPILEIEQLGTGPIATAQLQDVLDDPVHALRVLMNNLRHTLARRLHGAGLRQQLARMADGAQRVADLVGDAGRQPSEGGQFHLLGLLRHGRGVLEKD